MVNIGFTHQGSCNTPWHDQEHHSIIMQKLSSTCLLLRLKYISRYLSDRSRRTISHYSHSLWFRWSKEGDGSSCLPQDLSLSSRRIIGCHLSWVQTEQGLRKDMTEGLIHLFFKFSSGHSHRRLSPFREIGYKVPQGSSCPGCESIGKSIPGQFGNRVAEFSMWKRIRNSINSNLMHSSGLSILMSPLEA